MKGQSAAAAAVLRKALADPMTHVGMFIFALCDLSALLKKASCTVCCPRLEKRLARLEHKLMIDPSERYNPPDALLLRQSESRTVHGKRLKSRHDKAPPVDPSLFFASPSSSETLTEEEAVSKVLGWGHAAGHHSVWAGKNGAEVGVEELALEHYERLGYRGYVVLPACI